MGSRWIASTIIGAVCLLAVSCPNPLDKAKLLHVKDAIGPIITISSPT